jgi:ParB/RepB/Spo0J family partition protein
MITPVSDLRNAPITRLVNLEDIDFDREFAKNRLRGGAGDRLVASIRNVGVLQPPIVIETDDGRLRAIAGHRRLIASQQAGMRMISVVIINTDRPRLTFLLENSHREDLSPFELATTLAELKNEGAYTDAQLADLLGKKRTTITQLLNVNSIGQVARATLSLLDRPPSLGLLIELSQASEADQPRLAELIKNGAPRRLLRFAKTMAKSATRASPDKGFLEMAAKVPRELGDKLLSQIPGGASANDIAHLRELREELEACIKVVDGLLSTSPRAPSSECPPADMLNAIH